MQIQIRLGSARAPAWSVEYFRRRRGSLLVTLFVALVVGSLCGVGLARATDLTVVDDPGVYRAVLEKVILPGTISRSDSTGVPPAVFVSDTTVVPGVSGEVLEDFAHGSGGARRTTLGDSLPGATREELARSYQVNNENRVPLPELSPGWAVTVAKADLRGRLRQAGGGVPPYVSFSRPGYSSDGHALIYASHHCGLMCGYGWLILLERCEGGWQVVKVDLRWIS